MAGWWIAANCGLFPPIWALRCVSVPNQHAPSITCRRTVSGATTRDMRRREAHHGRRRSNRPRCKRQARSEEPPCRVLVPAVAVSNPVAHPQRMPRSGGVFRSSEAVNVAEPGRNQAPKSAQAHDESASGASRFGVRSAAYSAGRHAPRPFARCGGAIASGSADDDRQRLPRPDADREGGASAVGQSRSASRRRPCSPAVSAASSGVRSTREN